MQTFKCNLYFSFRKKQYQLFFTNSFQNYTFINPSLPLFTSHNLTRRRYRVKRKGSLIVLLRGRKGRDSIHPTVFGVYSWLWAQGSFQRIVYTIRGAKDWTQVCHMQGKCPTLHIVAPMPTLFFHFPPFPWNKPRIH